MRFSELYKNTNGKYSGSGFVGVVAGIASICCFISGIVAFYLKIPESLSLMDKSLVFLTIAAALLGVRKITKSDTEFKKE